MTQSFSSDPYNLDLSKRRAAAVKQALIERYHVSVDRLTTAGYGASRQIRPSQLLIVLDQFEECLILQDPVKTATMKGASWPETVRSVVHLSERTPGSVTHVASR